MTNPGDIQKALIQSAFMQVKINTDLVSVLLKLARAAKLESGEDQVAFNQQMGIVIAQIGEMVKIWTDLQKEEPGD